MAQPRGPPGQQCYFTLDDNIPPNAVRTCGDPIRAHLHLNPLPGETLSISNLRVNFKCKVRTLISTGSGNNRRTHKAKTYLFFFSTQIQGPRTITINSHQSWPVAFEFPWAVQPHPTQAAFMPANLFQHQPGHRLPPTFQRQSYGYVQSVRYYLEAVMHRQGRMIEHTDKKYLDFRFSPPLDTPDPLPVIQSGQRQSISRSSRLLDPEKRDEHYGFRERTKHLFSSEADPFATFGLWASAPTVCCIGDSLPITLHFKYNAQSSTAPMQPEVKLKSIHIRLNDFVQYRVPYVTLFSNTNLVRSSEAKVALVRRSFTKCPVVYDEMNLTEIANVTVGGLGLECSFSTFSMYHAHMLKISAVFECVGKEFDLVLYRRPLLIHPTRALFRQLPAGINGPHQPVIQSEAIKPDEETLPPYVPGPSENKPPPPSYEEDKSKT